MQREVADTVLLVGHSCVDLVPVLPAEPTVAPGGFSNLGSLNVRCGGSVVNTGEALVALGRTVRIVTSVGGDHLGSVLSSRLRQLDPSVELDVVDLGTSYSVVLERGGASRTIWHYEGSNTAFAGERVKPRDAALVHVGYATALPALLEHGLAPFIALLERISAAGATSSVDFATLDPRLRDVDAWPERLRRLLPLMDVVSPSADDLVSIGWLPPRPSPQQIVQGARRLVAAGAAVAFVTDGERGAHLCTGDAARLERGGRVLARLAREWAGVVISSPAVHVARVVGTNGAGDTATAGLIHGLLGGYNSRDTVRLAVALAAQRVAGRDLGAVGDMNRLADPNLGNDYGYDARGTTSHPS